MGWQVRFFGYIFRSGQVVAAQVDVVVAVGYYGLAIVAISLDELCLRLHDDRGVNASGADAGYHSA